MYYPDATELRIVGSSEVWRWSEENKRYIVGSDTGYYEELGNGSIMF